MSIKIFLIDIARTLKSHIRQKIETKRVLSAGAKFKNEIEASDSAKRIIYLGITRHRNLGDLAQFYCITRWIKTYCNEYKLIMTDADTVVRRESGCLDILKDNYGPDDLIVFQSGYTTQDLGGVHDLMHRMVAEILPDAKILMMPQTIFFCKEENKQNTAKILNRCPNLMFLARDFTSFETAKEMFPDVVVKAYPDIVTSLIGSYKFNNKREGVYLCHRNDDEKFYSDKELDDLSSKLSEICNVDNGDTNCDAPLPEIIKNIKQYIDTEIEKFSHYKVTITDRYHGTIFSLCAGTPVIIIKTNDHKVTTGADWFNGVYDGYITVAEDLDAAYKLAREIIEKKKDYPMLDSYFEKKYYGSVLRELVNGI